MQQGNGKTDNECRHGRCSKSSETYHDLGCLISLSLGDFNATEESGSHVQQYSPLCSPQRLSFSGFQAARSTLTTRMILTLYRYEQYAIEDSVLPEVSKSWP